MRLQNIVTEAEATKLMELDAPMLGAAPTGAQVQPASGPQQTTPPPAGTPQPSAAKPQQDPQAAAKMQAQQALDRLNQKKQLEDDIKQTHEQITQLQKSLQDKQKQLATLK
jgi:hypothetical protein